MIHRDVLATVGNTPLVALERVLRSMTTVAFLDHPDVMKALEESQLAATGA